MEGELEYRSLKGVLLRAKTVIPKANSKPRKLKIYSVIVKILKSMTLIKTVSYQTLFCDWWVSQ